jgi:hypothetical protein
MQELVERFQGHPNEQALLYIHVGVSEIGAIYGKLRMKCVWRVGLVEQVDQPWAMTMHILHMRSGMKNYNSSEFYHNFDDSIPDPL